MNTIQTTLKQTGDLYRLAGNHNRAKRKELAQALLGRKPQPSETGVTFLESLAYKLSGIDFSDCNCQAMRDRKYREWATGEKEKTAGEDGHDRSRNTPIVPYHHAPGNQPAFTIAFVILPLNACGAV